jgi:hypothetical protein
MADLAHSPGHHRRSDAPVRRARLGRTTIAQIDTVAGLSPGSRSLYRHFATRRGHAKANLRVQSRAILADDQQAAQLADAVFRIVGGRIAQCWLVPFDQHRFDELCPEPHLRRRGVTIARPGPGGAGRPAPQPPARRPAQHLWARRGRAGGPARPEHRQHHGFAHGGLLGDAADNALSFAAGALAGPGVLTAGVLTAGHTINVLAPVVGDRLLSPGLGGQLRPAAPRHSLRADRAAPKSRPAVRHRPRHHRTDHLIAAALLATAGRGGRSCPALAHDPELLDGGRQPK